MPEITIPDKLSWEDDLIITFPPGVKNHQAAIYESPRATYSEEDIQQKNPIWRGDVYEISHDDSLHDNDIFLKMRRGPDNHRALYGKYLVKARCIKGEKTLSIEKIIEVLPKP